MSITQEFKTFVMRGNVVDMAIGIIIGSAFGNIVTTLVQDVVMPPIGKLLGNINFQNFYFTLSAKQYPTITAAEKAGAPIIKYGVFVNSVVDFFIVSAVIFAVIKGINHLKRPVPVEATQPPEEVLLLREIRDSLKK